MAQITDPFAAFELYQKALSRGQIPLIPCSIDSKMFVCMDEPNGRKRFSYLKLDGNRMTALAMFVSGDFIEGQPSFNVGYAVDTSHRGQGLAKELVTKAISELKKGLYGAGISGFYVEAIVGLDNVASQRVANATISDKPEKITDDVSGLPALHYICKSI